MSRVDEDPSGGHEARKERLKQNERRLRRLNLRIEELNRVAQIVEDDEDADQAAFLCECSLSECTDRLPLDVERYAALHAEPGRFVLVPGHELPEVDRTLLRTDEYLVVCKP